MRDDRQMRMKGEKRAGWAEEEVWGFVNKLQDRFLGG